MVFQCEVKATVIESSDGRQSETKLRIIVPSGLVRCHWYDIQSGQGQSLI